jgi:hypothetical protein
MVYRGLRASWLAALVALLLLTVMECRTDAHNRSTADYSQQVQHVKRSLDRVMHGNPGRNAFTSPQATSLLAITTSNVWNKTQLMLSSIFAVRDKFDILVIDEKSNDGTVEMLAKYGVSVLNVPEVKGVTYNWNLAYSRFVNSSYENLFIVNNDVLLPDGAFHLLEESLHQAGGDCDLVVPLSTVRGKGSWGGSESIEVIFKLTQSQRRWVQQAQHYNTIQQVLLTLHKSNPKACTRPLGNHHLPGFSGFFFGFRRSVGGVAAFPSQLWKEDLRNLGQESDLWLRLNKTGGFKMCINACSFVYHYKGSTIPLKGDRNNWVRQDLS